MTSANRPGDRDLDLDLESLKGLAHPLRVKIVDVLSVHGASTASGLGERLGESSGAMSYHLRQLEKHGFVREVVGKGTARERWWERVPGGLLLRPDNFTAPSVAREASTLVTREWVRNSTGRLISFVERSGEVSEEWIETAALITSNLRVTHEQLALIVERFTEHVMPLIDEFRGENDSTDARPVQINFNAFPVMDGPEFAEEKP